MESLDLIRSGLDSTVSEERIDISPCASGTSRGTVIKPARLRVRRPSLSSVTASLSLESHESVSSLRLCSATPSPCSNDKIPPEEGKSKDSTSKHYTSRSRRKYYGYECSHCSLKNYLIFVSVASNVFLFSFLMWHIYCPTSFVQAAFS